MAASNEERRARYRANIELNRAKGRMYAKRQAQNNPQSLKDALHRWRIKNREKIREYKRNYRRTAAYKIWRSKRQREKRATIDGRILSNVRGRLYRALNGSRKEVRLSEILGCSIQDFKIYLESRFDIGMSWGNYGSGWHIDHIIPCAIFELSKREHLKRCFHFSNMRPCWAEENIRKSDTVLSNQYELL